MKLRHGDGQPGLIGDALNCKPYITRGSLIPSGSRRRLTASTGVRQTTGRRRKPWDFGTRPLIARWWHLPILQEAATAEMDAMGRRREPAEGLLKRIWLAIANYRVDRLGDPCSGKYRPCGPDPSCGALQ